jgi:hypothetical protein
MITVKYVSHGVVRYFKTEHLDDAKLLKLILLKNDSMGQVEIWE